MGAAYFYHLTQSTLDTALHKLLPRALGAGWKVEIRGTELDRLKQLDGRLWEGPVDGFLAHGIAGQDTDPYQPILLSVGSSGQPCGCIMTIDGADISAEEVNVSDRVCVMFDGSDDRALKQARVQWKTLTDAGCSAQYWSEASGIWEKKAEK